MTPFRACACLGCRLCRMRRRVPRQILAWPRTIDAIGGSVLVAVVVAPSPGSLTGCAAYSNNPTASTLGASTPGAGERQPHVSLASTAGTQSRSALAAAPDPHLQSIAASRGPLYR